MNDWPNTPVLDSLLDYRGEFHTPPWELSDEVLAEAYEESRKTEDYAINALGPEIKQLVGWVDVREDGHGEYEKSIDWRNVGPLWTAMGEASNWGGTRRILGTEIMRRESLKQGAANEDD